MIAAELLHLRPPASASASSLLRRAGWLAPAAGGVFLGAGLFDLLPSSIAAIGTGAIGWAGAGLTLMMLASALASTTERKWVGWAAGLGIWVHSILEGAAAGTGYGVSLSAGLVISIGLVVHLVPESLALFGLLSSTGLPLKKAVIGCAVPWALVVAGFFVAQVILPTVASAPLGRTMAFGAGAFLGLAGLSWGQRSGALGRNVLVGILGIAWVAVHHLG